MGKTLQRQIDRKEKEKTRRELLAKLFFDFAKLVFAALVLGGMLPLFQGEDGTAADSNPYFMMVLGVIFTIVFVSVGNRILK